MQTSQDLPGRYGRVFGALDRGLPAWIELKLAAGHARDEAGVVELIRANPQNIDENVQHLAAVHPQYAERFEALVARARDEVEP